ncbi:MAG: GNAT family N-acetyltransferase [Dehalococcoidia bacterium]|nr:GNAT family N-acetyltransferase [Dehalococcoidia bacterium]|tara:strand:+ start:36 stop:665 length:630 start_codon:yes stop_codon:yes gene_type:complete
MADAGDAPYARLQGARIVLRDKKFEDAENDYRWRSDPELARLDAAIPLTMSFERYLKLFEDQMKYPTPGSHHYSIETLDGLFIGNCMYYDMDTVNREAELGIVIGDRDYWSDGYGYDAVTTLLDHMFNARNLKRVYLHTLEWNGRAQKSFSKSGFNPVKPVRRMAHDFLLMDVLREDWFSTSAVRLAARFRTSNPDGSQPSSSGQTTAD